MELSPADRPKPKSCLVSTPNNVRRSIQEKTSCSSKNKRVRFSLDSVAPGDEPASQESDTTSPPEPQQKRRKRATRSVQSSVSEFFPTKESSKNQEEPSVAVKNESTGDNLEQSPGVASQPQPQSSQSCSRRRKGCVPKRQAAKGATLEEPTRNSSIGLDIDACLTLLSQSDEGSQPTSQPSQYANQSSCETSEGHSSTLESSSETIGDTQSDLFQKIPATQVMPESSDWFGVSQSITSDAGSQPSSSSVTPLTQTQAQQTRSENKPLSSKCVRPTNFHETSTGFWTAVGSCDSVAPRWGHTFTPLDNKRILLCGGVVDDRPNPKSLTMYNIESKEWTEVNYASHDAVGRAWHTATLVAGGNLAVFGGETEDEAGNRETLANLMIFDTQYTVWYQPTTQGESPCKRSGHTAVLWGDLIVFFGGTRGRKWLNDVYTLDTSRWRWTKVDAKGTLPRCRSYHSATLVGSQMYVFGGNDNNATFDDLVVLNLETMTWWKPNTSGAAPKARVGHAAALIDDTHILLYGGWDYTADDGGDARRFDDALILDTETCHWKEVPSGAVWPRARTGHSMAICGEKLVLFGGRGAGDIYHGDIYEHDLSTQKL
eukprot:Rmarinus@m.12771